MPRCGVAVSSRPGALLPAPRTVVPRQDVGAAALFSAALVALPLFLGKGTRAPDLSDSPRGWQPRVRTVVL